MAIANTLSTLFLFDKESNRKTGRAARHKHNQSEIDQNCLSFGASRKISIDWDTSSFSLLEEVPKEYKTTRPDVIIICYEGVELGCGKVKPPKKCKELVDTDRARIAEICKRQLHLCLTSSKSPKEHCTFGVFVGGLVLELTKLEFDNGDYNCSILKVFKCLVVAKCKMPGRSEVHESIEQILEALYSFKVGFTLLLKHIHDKPFFTMFVRL